MVCTYSFFYYWRNLSTYFKKNKSIHLEKFIEYPKKFENSDLYKKWNELLKIRDVCNLSIEEKRASKEIGSSLEAAIKIKLNKENFELTKNIDMSELCITSSVIIEETKDIEIEVTTKKAKGNKCPVCWKISENSCARHSTWRVFQ